MIDDILKTLSDTELMVIADELLNTEVDEISLYKMIAKKGNKGETIKDIVGEVKSDKFRGTLPRAIAIELASRYRLVIQKLDKV